MTWWQFLYKAAVIIGVYYLAVWTYPILTRKTMSILRSLRRRIQREAPPRTLKDRVVAGETITYQGDFSFEEPRYQPRPIDPQNPPKVMFYRPKRENSLAFCTNCGDALERGDKALVFPATVDSAPEIICEDCVKKS